MNRIGQALLKSRDRIEVIDTSGCILETNDPTTHDRSEGRSWVSQWPETSRTNVLIGLEEALDGRTHRFEAYRPIEDDDAWWDVMVTSIEEGGIVTGALAVSRDITRSKTEQMQTQAQLDEARITAEERDLISREMRHRLKNQITAIRSLAAMTARDHPNTKNFMESYSRRLMSLSVSQDILSARDNRPVSLASAIDSILASTGRSSQVHVDTMPEADIAPQALATMALVMGELMTNSLKYGALSDNEGKVRIECRDKEGILTFTWNEDCGVPVVPAESGGSGMQLMKRMSANSGVDFVMEWLETGLTCRFGVNSRAIG